MAYSLCLYSSLTRITPWRTRSGAKSLLAIICNFLASQLCRKCTQLFWVILSFLLNKHCCCICTMWMKRTCNGKVYVHLSHVFYFWNYLKSFDETWYAADDVHRKLSGHFNFVYYGATSALTLQWTVFEYLQIFFKKNRLGKWLLYLNNFWVVLCLDMTVVW
jgi:hypothetical protein